MTIVLPLQPPEEARLAAIAQARGVSGILVREAVEKVLQSASGEPQAPRKSAYGLLAKYGPGPT